MFNDYFAEQCRLPIHAEYHLLPEFSLLTDSTLDLFTLNEWNILEILKHLPSNKATGPDGIGNFILKSTAVSIFKPLCKLFNYALNKKTFPKCWKIANVTTVFIDSGHYVSYIRQSNKWYHCDDKHITETNLLTLSNNVYLMFYAKEVDLGT